jgi:hypothetical protein
VLAAILLDYALVMAVAFLAFVWMQRKLTPPTLHLVILAVFPGLALISNRLLLAGVWLRLLGRAHPADVLTPNEMLLPLPLGWALLFWALWIVLVIAITRGLRRGPAICHAAAKSSLLAGGLLGLLLMVNLGRSAIRRLPDARLATVNAHASTTTPRPRLIWVVMDELAYKPVFEARPAGLELPHFDALHQQSVVFTNARPISYWTDFALPGLITGHQLSDTRYTYSNKLSYQYLPDHSWRQFDPQDSVFADAEKSGWNVAVSGWYIPYCAMFPGMLQRCFWTDNDNYSFIRADRPILTNVWNSFVPQLQPWTDSPLYAMRQQDNHAILDHARQNISNDQMDFVFIHIGAPHGPYLFDRRSGREDQQPGHSYLDGLAYADLVLGQLFSQMQTTPRWSSTTLIVNGDHSWRTAMWQRMNIWSDEDAAVSHGGKFDDRPLLLVHQPGQTEGRTVSTPTPLVGVHDIVESVLRSGAPALP